MRILGSVDMQTLSQPRDLKSREDSTVDEKVEHRSTCQVPTVVLDTDVVSHNMASRLCISFLGHVLFLKNQVPFPIVQLAKMPTKDSTTRASKRRQELLSSFDTLASHLYTTFIALSTALALRGCPESKETGTGADAQRHGTARAFFAVALGPTVGTAKSRVIVGIDGLETKVWGLREDVILDEPEDSASDSDEDEDEESEHDDIESSNEEVDERTSDLDDDEPPPPSRSPSPALSTDSDPPPPKSPLNTPSKPLPLRVEDPEMVRAAERLLSRTLASACAEDDGQGLASEMAPTQIHVLLRAPRRFDHPSWIPRQNLCPSLDSYLANFLVESGELAPSATVPKKRTKANKVQGIWIKSSGGARTNGSEENLAEEDELIWWSWEGKLAGFIDW